MNRVEIDSFKQYLTTGDPRFHPRVQQKQAALEHDHQVKVWKQKLAAAWASAPPPEEEEEEQQSLMGELATASKPTPTYPIGKTAADPNYPYLQSQFGDVLGRIAKNVQRGNRRATRSVIETTQGLTSPGADAPKGGSVDFGSLRRTQAMRKANKARGSAKPTEKRPTEKSLLTPREHQMQLLKRGLPKQASQKEARCGHPANIALARAVRPGILPGMSENRGLNVSFGGDFESPIAEHMKSRANPDTLEYLFGQSKSAKEAESTQDEEIEQKPEQHGVAVKEQEIETEPKLRGQEKTAKDEMEKKAWWFQYLG